MDGILAWELVEWSLGSTKVELATWWRWSNDLLVNKVSNGMTSPLSSLWHCWSLLGPLKNLMMNKLGWAFFELILWQSNLILVGIGEMMLGFWLFLWSESLCQFGTSSEPLHCVHLDPLAKWIVSIKLGLSFTKSHGWTIRFELSFIWFQTKIMRASIIRLWALIQQDHVNLKHRAWAFLFCKMTEWVPSIGLGFWIY